MHSAIKAAGAVAERTGAKVTVKSKIKVSKPMKSARLSKGR